MRLPDSEFFNAVHEVAERGYAATDAVNLIMERMRPAFQYHAKNIKAYADADDLRSLTLLRLPRACQKYDPTMSRPFAFFNMVIKGISHSHWLHCRAQFQATACGAATGMDWGNVTKRQKRFDDDTVERKDSIQLLESMLSKQELIVLRERMKCSNHNWMQLASATCGLTVKQVDNAMVRIRKKVQRLIARGEFDGRIFLPTVESK